jgi:hypothetical protein
VENRLHCVRDVVLAEDLSQIPTGSGPAVMAVLLPCPHNCKHQQCRSPEFGRHRPTPQTGWMWASTMGRGGTALPATGTGAVDLKTQPSHGPDGCEFVTLAGRTTT